VGCNLEKERQVTSGISTAVPEVDIRPVEPEGWFLDEEAAKPEQDQQINSPIFGRTEP
jgi:hypothetical protein